MYQPADRGTEPKRTLARSTVASIGSKRSLEFSSGVVMDREDANGAALSEDLEEASLEPISAAQMTPRMKQLLFGVRLSAACEPLRQADDLDRLAKALDMARKRNNPWS
jgi:hypothetical protein